MKSEEIFASALYYEKKIRDLYVSAAEKIDDERGKKIFTSLADDEQSHVDFLVYNLERLKKQDEIDTATLESPIPSKDRILNAIEKMKEKIPETILGDVKRVLNSALTLEIETSAFYQDAYEKTQGPVKEIFKKILEIEQRHVDVVQIELDHASNNGYWFNFMEIDMEQG